MSHQRFLWRNLIQKLLIYGVQVIENFLFKELLLIYFYVGAYHLMMKIVIKKSQGKLSTIPFHIIHPYGRNLAKKQEISLIVYCKRIQIKECLLKSVVIILGYKNSINLVQLMSENQLRIVRFPHLRFTRLLRKITIFNYYMIPFI